MSKTLPVTGSSSVAEGQAEDIDRAVGAARRAFEDSAWSRMSPAERERLIHRLADLIEEHADTLAEIEALDNGKSVVIARQACVQANCQASSPDSDKSAFFLDAQTGAELGMWTLPRAQSDIENCTIHNFNVVPVRSGNYVLVSGNYQSGTSIVDFTDLDNPVEIAYSDPPPIPPPGGGGGGPSPCSINPSPPIRDAGSPDMP